MTRARDWWDEEIDWLAYGDSLAPWYVALREHYRGKYISDVECAVAAGGIGRLGRNLAIAGALEAAHEAGYELGVGCMMHLA